MEIYWRRLLEEIMEEDFKDILFACVCFASGPKTAQAGGLLLTIEEPICLFGLRSNFVSDAHTQSGSKS